VSAEPSATARLFVALWPPAGLARAVAAAVDGVLGGARGLRLVREGELHLTLEFLGPVERAAVPDLARALAEDLDGVAAPRLALAGAGCFPPRGRPRVWWLGLAEAEPRLAALRAAARAAAVRAGWRPAGGRKAPAFAPHLTVARTRERAGVPRALEETFGALRVEGRWTADEVLLVESRLGAPRPERYAVLERVALATGPDGGAPART
jgi:2'-5' RNA ligase